MFYLIVCLSYYDIPVNEVRQFINVIDNDKTGLSTPPFISKKLRELVEIPEPVDGKKLFDEFQQKIEIKLKQKNDELMKDMQELLRNLVKKSNINIEND